MSTLIEQLRQAVVNSGGSQAEVSRYSGIGPAALSRFLSGQAGLSLRSIDALASALRVRLVTANEWEQRERIWTLYKSGILRTVGTGVVDDPVGGGTG
jgi:transcriptional regulator with XRE-family HTH domain